MTELVDLRQHSVTRDDTLPQPGKGAPGAFTVWLAPDTWGGGLLSHIKGATGLPARGILDKGRDMILSGTPLIENMWASALNIAITKQAALGFRIEDQDDSERRINHSQELLLNFDGNYVYGLGRHLHDYLTTDTGAFMEIVRASNASGSRVLGLMHLDSLHCYRTGDANKPLVYMDRKGRYHWLDAEDVLTFVDMPSPRRDLNGIGLCAASRAWEAILKLVGIETYFREKITGKRNLAIHIVSGLTASQLNDALGDTRDEQDRKGFVLYRGSTIVPLRDISATPSVVTIPLAEVPDGFSAEQERKEVRLIYANAIGIAVQELEPLSGQGLGTGTQSVILDEAAEGRGIAAWRRDWTHQLSNRVLPKTTTFYLAVNDIRDKKAQAEVTKLRAEARKLRIEAGEISPAEARQLALDDGDLPAELAEADATPAGALYDTDKPLLSALGVLPRMLPRVPPGATPRPAAGTPRAPNPETNQPAMKETRYEDLKDEAVQAALDLAREVRGGA